MHEHWLFGEHVYIAPFAFAGSQSLSPRFPKPYFDNTTEQVHIFSAMAKTIAVTGSTGTQGGAVVRVLLEAGWKVKAITRNTSSESAKKLASQGAEVVKASYDDEASLVKAFEVRV